MVLGAILKFSTVGAVLAGAILFLTRSAQVGIGQAGSEVGQALQSLGQGGSSVGKGIEDTLTGLGVGGARLFDPLFTLKTLVFGDTDQAGFINVNPETVGGSGDLQNVSFQEPCYPIGSPECARQRILARRSGSL